MSARYDMVWPDHYDGPNLCEYSRSPWQPGRDACPNGHDLYPLERRHLVEPAERAS